MAGRSRATAYDNWRLSTARAHSAYYMLVRAGLDEKRITEVAGFADRKLKIDGRPVRRRQPAHRDPAGGRADEAARRATLLAALASLGARRSGAGRRRAAALEPYQMVRSLQLVQDRIAVGDHAALPMQRKLLEMIDERLRSASSHDFVDQRNFRPCWSTR